MSNASLEVSQWGRPPVARSHTVKTGPINLTLKIPLFQEQKRGRGRKNPNKMVAPSLLTQWINVNIMIMSCVFFLSCLPVANQEGQYGSHPLKPQRHPQHLWPVRISLGSIDFGVVKHAFCFFSALSANRTHANFVADQQSSRVNVCDGNKRLYNSSNSCCVHETVY